jgi:DNA-binding CsgD family transcriptional regulator
VSAPTIELLGREHAIRAVEALLDAASEQGGALLLRGDPGIGKSALLDRAKVLARDRGMRVLVATGVQSETSLPFTGLNELLRPVLDRVGRLPVPQQSALRSAFGMAESTAADLFLIALGALELLAEYALECPLVIVVDNLQWLDQSSTSALSFIVRRIQSEPMVVLMGCRGAAETPFDGVVPELHLAGLNAVSADALLKSLYPDLGIAYRQRILEESAGNPLALIELPKAIEHERSIGGFLPAQLPLTAKLERAFAFKLTGLPPDTRALLLAAALTDTGSIAEILAGAKELHGSKVSPAALTPAISAGLIDVDTVTLRFRHPLARSAIHAASSPAERIAAHAALAAALRSDPDRHAWHRAAATLGHDDAIAVELESVAARALQRGDARAAIHALDRAAQLSAAQVRQGRCLVRAAELAFDIGWPKIVVELLDRTEKLELTSRDRIKVAWYREATVRTMPGGEALRKIAATIQSDDDLDLALDLLAGPATRRWWVEPDQRVCDLVVDAVQRANVRSQDDPRFLLVLAMTAPVEQGAFLIEQLRRLEPACHDAQSAKLLGLIATQVGDFDAAIRFFNEAVPALRSDGRLAALTDVLMLRALSAIYRLNRDMAVADAQECERFAGEIGNPVYQSGSVAASAILAALRGDHDTADELAVRAERITQPLGILVAEVPIARGTTALAAGEFEDAYRHFARLFDPQDIACHPMKQWFHIGDLAEAAIQCGHAEEASALLAEAEAIAKVTPSPQLHEALQHARAILAGDDNADAAFEAALAADVSRTPYAWARLRLAYGMWLRRAQSARVARPHLQAALEAFDALSVVPWGNRARQELRAAGVARDPQRPHLREQLTPQELQIALMAAQGLSNRDIGAKLYLSHRTVGSHLYRIFPKLEIASRHQLRDAMAVEGPVLT